jgi:hypothetical protein
MSCSCAGGRDEREAIGAAGKSPAATLVDPREKCHHVMHVRVPHAHFPVLKKGACTAVATANGTGSAARQTDVVLLAAGVLVPSFALLVRYGKVRGLRRPSFFFSLFFS